MITVAALALVVLITCLLISMLAWYRTMQIIKKLVKDNEELIVSNAGLRVMNERLRALAMRGPYPAPPLLEEWEATEKPDRLQ